jgi:TetR/AcrR family transcriptional regulator, transcriptional repressor for nem operon
MNETREHILKTSMLLFLQKSYKDVTMKEIVKKTGLSKGAFYHYFNAKEELFREIAFMFFSIGSVDYSGFSTSSLRAFYNDYIEFLNQSLLELNNLVPGSSVQTGTFNIFLIMFHAISRFPEFLKMELDIHERDLKAWEEAIARARKQMEIKSVSSDEDLANLFLYCTDGVFIRFLNDNKQGSYKEYLVKAYDAIYNGLKT